jgi:hypothetical protein
MARDFMALRRPLRPAKSRRPQLQDANVLIVEADWATATLLRASLETDYAANVEIAADYEAALDFLGNAARPVSLMMLDPALPGQMSDALMLVLREHRARVHVTLHGNTPPEALPNPANFVGAAAYTHLATSVIACAAAATVVDQGLTVLDIIDRRRVPQTLDWQSAIAIYAAEPGQPFPLTIKT